MRVRPALDQSPPRTAANSDTVDAVGHIPDFGLRLFSRDRTFVFPLPLPGPGAESRTGPFMNRHANSRQIMNLPHIVLFQPEIPPNSGNIIRLCANTGAPLHFVHPLGFRLEDRRLRRAGLDYAEFARIHEHRDLAACLAAIRPARVFALTRNGETGYTTVRFGADDALLFGPETRGLPAGVLADVPAGHRLRIPMRPGSRSMNLANSVAVVVFEAWRQGGFDGGTPS